MTILNNRSLYLDVWETVGTGGRMERKIREQRESRVCNENGCYFRQIVQGRSCTTDPHGGNLCTLSITTLPAAVKIAFLSLSFFFFNSFLFLPLRIEFCVAQVAFLYFFFISNYLQGFDMLGVSLDVCLGVRKFSVSCHGARVLISLFMVHECLTQE